LTGEIVLGETNLLTTRELPQLSLVIVVAENIASSTFQATGGKKNINILLTRVLF